MKKYYDMNKLLSLQYVKIIISPRGYGRKFMKIEKILKAIEELRQNFKDDAHLFDEELIDTIEKELVKLFKENVELKNIIKNFNEAIGEPQILRSKKK